MLGRRGSIGVMVGCAVLVGGLLGPAAVSAGAVRAGDPPPTPLTVTPGQDLVCPNLFGYTDTSLRRRTARAIMSGVVDMGEYGTMTIPVNPVTAALVPVWRTQSTLDLAGNRYLDSLRWTLPLLRVGLDLGGDEGAAMTTQFVALLRSWVASQPAPAKRGFWVNHPQYGGFRLAVFVCGARELPDPVDNAWMVAQARAELAVQLKNYSLSGSNNTMLNAQLAAYAAARQVGTAAQQSQARANVLQLVANLTNRDGSDEEGAPGYGLYLDTIEARTATVLDQYGQAGDAATVRSTLARSAAFITAASRPDRRLETIGDTDYGHIPVTLFGPSSPATWVATSGEQGTTPTQRYSSWVGGYAFGRSGWVAGQDLTSTFYSVRTGLTTPNAAHRHSDTTGITWYSRGVSWVADPGPYRYDTSVLRSYVRGRSAHSALVVSGRAAFVAPARWVKARSSHGVDTTCLRDPAYESTAHVQLVRCVYYLRDLDALVVQDFVRPTARSTAVRQQFVLPPEVTGAVADGGRVALTGTTGTGLTRTADLTSTGRPQVKRATATRAVLGRTYGQREYGRLVQVPWTAPVGLTSSTTTVLAARPAAVSRTTVGGAAALRVTVGSRSAVVRTAYTRFPRPSADPSLHAKTSHVRRGATIVLKGTVRAAGRRLPGIRVELARRTGHGWVAVRTVTASPSGRFTFRVPANRKGGFAYRVQVGPRGGAAGWKKAHSHTVVVTVAKRHH